MKKTLFIPAICILLVSCNDKPANPNGNPSNYSNENSNNYSNGNSQMQSQMAVDADLTNKVNQSLLTDPSFTGINVSTTNGVVTLTGTVANQDVSSRAGQAAQGVSGVKNVINNLTISSSY